MIETTELCAIPVDPDETSAIYCLQCDARIEEGVNASSTMEEMQELWQDHAEESGCIS